MDKSRPWIKYWKKSEHDELYNSDPFDRWHAWTDLLLIADENGTVKTTLKSLQIRWKWGSRRKVLEHLRTLSETGKVTLTGTPNGTSIFINKYWGYQNNFNIKKMAKGNTSRNTSRNTFGNTEDTIVSEGGYSPSPSGEVKPQEEKKKPDDDWESIKDDDFDDE